MVAESTSETAPPAVSDHEDVLAPPDSRGNASPLNSPDRDLSDDDESAEDYLPIDQIIAELKAEVSQVKNKRICTLSAYDYMRHLSILRFFEWTVEEGKPEQDAARELAMLLWEHKTGVTHSPRNSIQHKTKLIQRWAKEYRTTGGLVEHAHGIHKKTESTLAREDVAKAALKALAKMNKPGPSGLREILLNKIFPKLGIEDSKISENTCRNYMQQWGWIKGPYNKQWTPKNQQLLHVSKSESDEDNFVSDETAILDTQKAPTQKTSLVKPTGLYAPIPSPTTAIRSAASAQPAIMTHVATTFDNLHNSATLTSPIATFGDSTITMTNQNSNLFFSQMPTYPSQQTPLYSFQPQPSFQNMVPFQQQSHHQQFPPPPHGYIPKSLDGLVSDPPDMMGIRPAFNGDPIQTFAPHPSLMGPFSNSSTFPPQINRRHSVNNPHVQNYNSSSQLQFMPDMSL